MLDLADDVVLQLARAATRRPDAEVAAVSAAPLGHRIENMTTNALDRVCGTLTDGTPWSVVAKTLHPASDSPAWASIPEDHRDQVLRDLDWLDEPRIYRSGLRDDVPDGFRLPDVHRIDESRSRITIWMEDVDDAGGWDLDRYHRTASRLAELAGTWPEDRAVRELGIERRRLDSLFFGKVCHLDLVIQADDAFWSSPEIRAVVDRRHRDDLGRLAEVTPSLLERSATRPHSMSHGDAAPDNLREPGDGTVVAIDWSYGSIGPLGCDLAQLLAGRVESGAAGAEDIPSIAAAVVEGYLDGLAGVGADVEPWVVRESWATHLAVRSVFSALVVDHRPDLDDAARQELLARRAALGRFGLDLVAQVLDGSGA
jgi:hypothetical protein